MADADILIRGVTTGMNTTATVAVNSHADTVAGDYLAVFSSLDYTDTHTIASPPSGVDAWTVCASADDGTTEHFRAWLAKVTTDGAKTVTVQQPGSSGLYVIVATLDPQGGTVTLDGTATTNVDKTSPFAHGSVTVAGTKSMLVCGHGQVQFSGTTAYGTPPSGMTELADLYYNQYSGIQVCYQMLTAAGASGGKSQTSAPTTVTGGAGGMFALRNDVTATGPEPGRFLIAV